MLLRLRSWMCGRRISIVEGLFPGAVNIPLDEFDEKMEAVDKDKTVYVLCHTGDRSRDCVEKLE